MLRNRMQETIFMFFGLFYLLANSVVLILEEINSFNS